MNVAIVKSLLIEHFIGKHNGVTIIVNKVNV